MRRKLRIQDGETRTGIPPIGSTLGVAQRVKDYIDGIAHSLEEKATWVVFEPNTDPTWGRVRDEIEATLMTEWRAGRLRGIKPEEAFFVRCDRTTMTQNDIDEGRLICLVGMAVLRPAEFEIIRIGHQTADTHIED